MQARAPAPLLVLGASGFLGRHLVARALQWAGRPDSGAGLRVLGVARSGAPVTSTLRDGAQWHALELSAAGALEAFFDEHRPAVVWNGAALSRVAECERQPELARWINAEIPGRLAAWCRAAGSRLVHVSTDLVFGGEAPPSAGFPEAAPPTPISTYGATKAEGEQRVLEAFPGALVVRLPLLYGNSYGRGLGASDALMAAVERGERPALFVDERRTPLEVSNGAEALLELALGDRSGLLHVAGPERLSRHELGLAVLEARGRTPRAAREALREARRGQITGLGPRPADVSLDAARARALLRTRLLAPREALRDRAG